MRCTWPPRFALAVAWLALGCGGKTLETTEHSQKAADDCTELQNAADIALQSLVEMNNGCISDADCASVETVGGCYTYCVVPLRRSNVSTVIESERNLCRSYAEHGCSIGFACPNVPGTACIAGKCMFKF